MGKGDKKTRRGKIIMKSYGVTLRRKKKRTGPVVIPKVEKELKPVIVKAEEPVEAILPPPEVQAPEKKTEKAPKKAPQKKTTAKKPATEKSATGKPVTEKPTTKKTAAKQPPDKKTTAAQAKPKAPKAKKKEEKAE